MKHVNWDDIRNEYIATDISYRSLAAKYDVNYQAIYKKSKAEKWSEKKETQRNKSITKTIEKTSDKAAERAANLMTATDSVLSAILNDIEKIKAADVPYNWKNITGALKDIRDIQTVSEEKTQNILIKLESDLEEWGG